MFASLAAPGEADAAVKVKRGVADWPAAFEGEKSRRRVEIRPTEAAAQLVQGDGLELGQVGGGFVVDAHLGRVVAGRKGSDRHGALGVGRRFLQGDVKGGTAASSLNLRYAFADGFARRERVSSVSVWRAGSVNRGECVLEGLGYSRPDSVQTQGRPSDLGERRNRENCGESAETLCEMISASLT